MNLIDLILNLLILQGLLGAFDTIYHHELRCALPQQSNAAVELRLHAIRAVLYGLVFGSLAWFAWGGATLLIFWGIIGVEILLTLRDFVEEDRTRRLPASERILHTILAINGGAVFALLAWYSQAWWSMPTGLHVVSHGWKSGLLSLFAVGVILSGIRDGLASRAITALNKHQGKKFKFRNKNEENTALSFLITGGTGFIGQALVRALLADGHCVTLWARDPLKAGFLFNGRVECVTALSELNPNRSFDIIINLAGAPILGPRWSQNRKAHLVASRVNTTQQLTVWIRQLKQRPRLVISGSAIGYYGVQESGNPDTCDEASPGQEIFVSELCYSWEQAARPIATLGIPLALIRLGVVLGHQGALPPMLLPIRIGLGGPLSGGKQTLGWIHIADVIGIIAWLCRQEKLAEPVCTYNLVAPDMPTQKDFAATAAKILRRPAFVPTPGWIMKLVLGEQATLLLDGQKVIPGRLLRENYRFRHPYLEQALENLLCPGGYS